ncbi:MAG TPA: hypothetical protein VHT96_02705 [Clostridia bacterium]|nr:hypothetical protein [Clostridia bacterium]
MSKLETMCSAIMKEADDILYKMSLLDELKKYGDVFITGSYYLNLMTWRDLDLYIDNSNMSNEHFFRLGHDIASIIQPHRMHYRNEFIGNSQGLPKGLYWGIYTNIIEPGTWKIDLWAVDSMQFAGFKNDVNKLKSKIDSYKREMILEIKANVCNHPFYRKEFTSVDIYQAVLDESVINLEEFKKWLKENKNVTL